MKKACFCLVLFSLAACSQSEVGGYSSMTVNLVQQGEPETIACEAAFATRSAKIHAGADGSKWLWTKDADGTLSHYCREQKDGAVSAWAEAKGSDTATHSLKFDSNDSAALFVQVTR
jgi:hypothetical protein